jgi:outer membrane protein assembly factor BamA
MLLCFMKKLSMSRALAGVVVLAWLVLASAPAPVFAQERGVITEIRFVGNKHTQPQILLQEMVVKAGDLIDPERIEQSRQAIMDLGLFKSVDVALIPDAMGEVLEITVSEKYYIIPLPKLDRSADGDVSYGGQLTVDNLWGLNQKLKLRYKAERGCCENSRTVSTYSLEYEYPRVAGTDYGMGMTLIHEATPQADLDLLGGVVSEYEENLDSVAAGVSHWLGRRDGPSSGWSVGLSGFWRHLTYRQQGGIPIVYGPEKAVGVTLSLGYTKVHDLLYSRDGLEFGISSEHGLESLGSDVPYSRSQLYYRQYRPVGNTPHTNVDLQVRLGVTGGDVPIDEFSYGLGGSRDLRGYDKSSIEGRSFFVANVEYLRPLFGHPAARGVLFMDVGNAYADNRLVDLGDLHTSAGVGLRYKFKAFVNLQLRADMAYAFGLSASKIYIGVKDTF